jgi:hypothetical protein
LYLPRPDFGVADTEFIIKKIRCERRDSDKKARLNWLASSY